MQSNLNDTSFTREIAIALIVILPKKIGSDITERLVGATKSLELHRELVVTYCSIGNIEIKEE